MSDDDKKGPPSPDDLQKQLSDFLKNFGGAVAVNPFSSMGEPPSQKEEEEPPPGGDLRTPDGDIFDFHYRPKDIKEHLDRFVIRQDEAKKALSIAVCDHYNHAKFLRNLENENPSRAKEIELQKQNVIVVGPTGVGKTYLVKHIADLIGVPFVKADATKFSETGYVGGDVDDLVRELVRKADGDVELAEYGIVYIDEVDKLATSGNMIGRDVSGRGVQTTLLKLMEDTEVALRNEGAVGRGENYKKTARTAIRKLREMTDKAEAEKFLPKVISMIDKLGKKHTWHPNKASNLKGKLTRFVNSLG